MAFNTFKILIAIFIFAFLLLPSSALAIVDPLASPNNKFGIHIISPSVDESSPAATLVNSSGGDWGYVTILAESNNRDQNKWQTFFNDLRRRHLIPLVRLATQPQGNIWKLPYEGEEEAWVDFLDHLIWPTKNRYIIIYNEPNQGQEWAGKVDPASYAKILDKTVTALKAKNPDFFVLNAGLDASAPNQLPAYLDEEKFLEEMAQAVPGIFNKLDGWVSHSYPNPGFVGSPTASGKGTVQTWAWELEKLKELGLNKNLPVFITETGWKHAEGLNFDKSLPSSEQVGKYLKQAFESTWASSQIVAVCPFLLDYQEEPFDHFSFKKPSSEKQNLKVLGISYPLFYPQYQTVLEMPKISGKPIQENKAELIKGGVYPAVVAGENYVIPITFKNTGQSIWNESEVISLKALEGAKELGITQSSIIRPRIEPGGETTFHINLKAPQSGNFRVSLQLYQGNKAFDQKPFVFTTQVKSPVILKVNAALEWKKIFGGEYLMKITSEVVQTTLSLNLDNFGQSKPIEVKYLIPDQNVRFTLYKPFYKPKIIELGVISGINQLDFGSLQPDILTVLLNPSELWKLLPFSN
ncbi:MAG: hypothetical protein V1808_00655 [Candidatus Daviesbacteria bacterium]